MSGDIHKQFKQAVVAHRHGDYALAIEICDSILSNTGNRPDILNLKAVALAESGQMILARGSILAAMEVIDENASVEMRSLLCVHAARILAALDLYHEAFTLAGEAAGLLPSDPACFYQHARLALLCGDTNKASELIRVCLGKFPAFVEARMLEAQIAMETADLNLAEDSFKAIVAAEPLHARAWAGLAEISPDRQDAEPVMASLRAIHDAGVETEHSPGDWATATFALADAHASAGEHSEAFELFRSANQQLSGKNSWNPDLWESRTQNTILEATPHEKVPDHRDRPSPLPNPLMIVGMPRSGSSLLERMLGAHSKISSSGERESMTHIERYLESSGIETTAVGSGLNADLVNEMRVIYRDGMNPGKDSLWVTDKANRNFERLGLVKQLFPDSRIIWILRNPLDTVLSCYFQDFQHGLGFSNSLVHLARMYDGHWRLMKKWVECFSSSILLLRYQDLVQKPEDAMLRVCDFFNLDFQAEMLQPHLRREPVRTASTLQVQQPIHTAAIGRWRDYSEQLTETHTFLQKAKIIDKDGEMMPPGCDANLRLVQ